MDTVTNALSKAIGVESLFQIKSIKAAQKMQNASMKINNEMAQSSKKSLLNDEKKATTQEVVSILMLATTIAIGVGVAADGASLFADEGNAGKLVKFAQSAVKLAQPALKGLGAISGFGTFGATIAESVYQAKGGSLEGEITKEQADIGSLQTASKRLTKTMSSTVQSEQTLATVSSEVISNNLAANTAR